MSFAMKYQIGVQGYYYHLTGMMDPDK